MNSASDTLEISEVKDIHPIFRANPYLIESGATLVKGEKYPSSDTLKHIDIMLRDANGIPLFAEIKWSAVSETQVSEYRRLIKKHFETYRLMWVIPDDFSSKISKLKSLGVEVKTFERKRLTEMVKIRRLAHRSLLEIKQALQQSFDVTMHGEKIRFEDPIHACYFEGRVETDKGVKKVGMKQSGIGRYLDLIRCITNSPVANVLPELSMEFLWELLVAPYCYKPAKFWVIMKEGFVEAKRTAHLPSSLTDIISSIWNVVDHFHGENKDKIRSLYDNDIRKYDLLLRMIDEAVPSDAHAATVSIKSLVNFFIDKFALVPTTPTPKVWHSTLNQWVQNIVTTSGYENDFAKRIIEIAVLKRMLIPVRGITIMWVLAPRYRDNKLTVDRVPCQSFTYNRDPELYLEVKK